MLNFAGMKRGLLISVSLVGISLFLFSAGSILLTSENNPSEREVIVALRNVGHIMLLRSGDSTTRVLPIVNKSDNVYEVSFEADLSFATDTIVAIAERSLHRAGITVPYVVSVISCKTREVIYGFRIGNQKQETVVPCLGREQPRDCYIVEVAFLVTPRNMLKFYALAAVGLVLAGGTTLAIRRTGNHPQAVLSGGSTIGSSVLFVDRKIVMCKGSFINLSDKETKLLAILAGSINQPISREQLMKEVWNDNGALITRSLDVFISKLRKKLADDTSIQLTNIHGVGYVLKVLPS